MAPCIATCKDGTPCAFNAKFGFTVCGRHMNQGISLVFDESLCGIQKSTGTACTKVRAEGEEHCAYHVRIQREREEKRQAVVVWARAMSILWDELDPARAVATLEAAVDAGRMPIRLGRWYFDRMRGELAFFNQEHEWRIATAPPRGELEALARDRQNVHTSAVTQQTRTGLDVLLETPVSSTQETLREIQRVWEKSHTRSIRMVLQDMHQWYSVSLCRTEDDWLYRRTLDGLWAYIQRSPAKDDLAERLWEECYESVGMCCDGHLSRLCNVLCGFTEEFKPPVSVGELLQQRMAVIAEKQIPVEEKVGEAWAVFEELSVPMDQREAWVDAF
jgi:hypothetical protein